MKASIRLLFAAAGLLALACTTAEDLTNEGWELYEQGSYSQALAKFQEAISSDDTYADAYNGEGWSNAELDDLAASGQSFENCLDLDDQLTDGHAGIALAYSDLPDDSACIVHAAAVISRQPAYEFIHKNSVTIEDIRLVKAKSCCNTGDFAEALVQIRAIDTAFSADPNSAAGQQAILEKLEKLIALYR